MAYYEDTKLFDFLMNCEKACFNDKMRPNIV